MNAKSVAAALMMTLAGATALRAQTQAQVRQEEMRFRAMDTNGDGQVSRQEWRGSAASFRVHDWNGDGVLSGAEIRAAARRQAAEPEDYNPSYYGYNDWSQRGFTALDINRDGRISRAEWHYDYETFLRVDRDRNGFITRAEFLSTDASFDDDRGDKFDDLDWNGNNRIEPSEWHGSTSAFQWMDRNRDGVLSRAEVLGNTPQNDDQFSSLDTNRDRAIVRSEWPFSAPSFGRLDRNGDGRISRAEFEGAGPLGTGTTARVEVNGFDRWTDTGIYLQVGDEVTFNATGSIQFAQAADTAVGWRGAADGRKSPNAPMPNLPIGHLIVRVGGGPIMSSEGTVRAANAGRLYLGVNDDVMTDNSGSFQVSVTVRRP